MKDSAQIVVIGGGIVGCSVAYHLAEMGCGDVILVEKDELTSGSTWHAAGLVGQLRSSPAVTEMLKYSVQLYARLEEETGQYTGWHQVGSLRLACSPDRMTELRRSASLARCSGLCLELISPDEASRLFPVMSKEGVLGAAFLDTDGYVDPSGLTHALAKGARNRGVQIYRHTRVTGIELSRGAVSRVKTDRGDIKAEVVVNAAGMWAKEIGRMVGVELPIQPMAHQYLLTTRIDGLPEQVPTMRDPDGLIYYRGEMGGLIMGGYEENPIPWAIGGIPADFSSRLLKPDFDHFEPLALSAMKRTPVLAEAQVVKLFNGPEAFTPDGQFLMGELPDVKGFFVLAGFNAFGIAAAGGAGRMLAEWILEGSTSLDLWDADIRRLGPHHASPKVLISRACEAYATHYSVSFPHHEWRSARPIRTSPLYQVLKAKRAVFGTRFGWERPNWFAPEGTEPEERPSWGRPHWFETVGEEHRAIRERAGIIDLSSLSKIEIKGPEALGYLQGLTDNQLDRPDGSIVYTQMLNRLGGIECDLIVARLRQDHFYLTTGTAFGRHDIDWIKRHLPFGRALRISDVTSQRACVGLYGPEARNILQAVAKEDVSNEKFPFMTCREIHIGRAPCLALRVSYVGELGWEFHVPTNYALYTYNMLFEAGKELGIADVGYRAVESCRLEKGYRYWSRELTPGYTPYEAGLDFCVDLEKGDFLGKEALLEQAARGIKRRLCCLTMDGQWQVPYGNEPVFDGSRLIGMVTSGGYGYTMKKVIMYAYLPVRCARPGTSLEVELFQERYRVTVMKEPLYDPERKRLKG